MERSREVAARTLETPSSFAMNCYDAGGTCQYYKWIHRCVDVPNAIKEMMSDPYGEVHVVESGKELLYSRVMIKYEYNEIITIKIAWNCWYEDIEHVYDALKSAAFGFPVRVILPYVYFKCIKDYIQYTQVIVPVEGFMEPLTSETRKQRVAELRGEAKSVYLRRYYNGMCCAEGPVMHWVPMHMIEPDDELDDATRFAFGKKMERRYPPPERPHHIPPPPM